MNTSQDNLSGSGETKCHFESVTLTYICPTLWLMLGYAIHYDFGIGQIIRPDLPDFENLKFTVVAIESYKRALSEIGHGMSCHLIVQVPRSSDDDLIKTLPETFLLKAVF